MKKTKWIIYTLIIGMIPFLIRSFIALIDKTATINFWLNPMDFIVLGLVLNLTNINELEDKTFENQIWKTKKIGFSIISLIIFSAFLAIITYTDFKKNPDINETTLKICSITLAMISVIFSYSIYNRLNTSEI